MAADELEMRRQRRGGLEHHPLRAAGVGHDRRLPQVSGQERERRGVLQHRRRQHDEIGVCGRGQRVSPAVRDPHPQRGVDDRRPIDRGDDHRRPATLDGERDRSADEAEAVDRDAPERRLAHTPQPRRETGSRQMPRPMAGAMIRSSAIRRSNWFGNSDCAPSLSA